MPKKTSRNAFYFFMKEYQQRYQEKTGLLIPMSDLVERVHPMWKVMTPFQRAKYDKLAKEAKLAAKDSKLTNTGDKISKIQEKAQQEEKLKENIINEIKATIRHAGDLLCEVYFYIIYVNIFCTSNTSRCYPAEISLARFNLKNGVSSNDVFHALCKPGPSPLGYAYEIKKTAEMSHQIPYPNDECSNLHHILKDIIQFLSCDTKNNNSFPPVYAFIKNIKIAIEIMKTLCINFGYRENSIKVYSLEQLFYFLKNRGCESPDAPFKSVNVAKLILEKDVYEYTPGISCDFHEALDVPKHCSRSCVVRWAYTICDNCCQDHNVPLIPGQHVPINANIYKAKTEPMKEHVELSCSGIKTEGVSLEGNEGSFFSDEMGFCGISEPSSTFSDAQHSRYNSDNRASSVRLYMANWSTASSQNPNENKGRLTSDDYSPDEFLSRKESQLKFLSSSQEDQILIDDTYSGNESSSSDSKINNGDRVPRTLGTKETQKSQSFAMRRPKTLSKYFPD